MCNFSRIPLLTYFRLTVKKYFQKNLPPEKEATHTDIQEESHPQESGD